MRALPRLELSGPRLDEAYEALLASAEPRGGILRLVEALSAKCTLFASVFASERFAEQSDADLVEACTFAATARRRVGAALEERGIKAMREAIEALLDAEDADVALAAFCARFPVDRQHSWVRDLGAELLHFTAPDRFPLMTRWMWDARSSTGVLREIWHGDGVEAVADDEAAHVALRAELATYLKGRGVWHAVPLTIDLLCAQVYAGYIQAQGAAFLRADFSGDDDPGYYLCRMLGIDAPHRALVLQG